MLRVGRNLRDLDCPFNDEILFSIEEKFDIIQVWYNCGKIDSLYEKDVLDTLKNSKIQSIIHAAMDISDFDKYSNDLINKLIYLNHKELILHPMIKTKKINKETISQLEHNVLDLLNKLNELGITVYVENNHYHMQCFYTIEQWEQFFMKAPKNTELLIDVVHVLYNDGYEFLKRLIKIKRPKALHIADTIKGRINNKHLHLPIGNGIVDFEYIFSKILLNYDDLVILEIKNSDKNIIMSKNKITKIIKNS